jgi:hypothetical protein
MLLLRKAPEGCVLCVKIAPAQQGAPGPRKGQKSTLPSTIQSTN